MTHSEPHPDPGAGPAARRKLPIGIQTFRTIREEGCYYVDKTPFIRRLVDEGTHYFLSRPRRFGKSLLVDTIKELFEASEPLFRGLAVHDEWDWSVRRPVVRLDFSGNFTAPGNLHKNLMRQLDRLERRAGVDSPYDSPAERFAHLIETLHEREGERVAVLIDEYDKPILDALKTPETARANRDFLHGVYSIIKACDADVAFTLLTGVSKFSKVSLFSGLNNLEDVTLDPRYSAICGYTESDLDEVFAPELPGLDRSEIRRWYNGYGWLGAEKVYNPFDILLLFRKRRFQAHWFETGSPTFLIDTLVERGIGPLALEDMAGTDALLSAFDVDAISTEALLFQTGYLVLGVSLLTTAGVAAALVHLFNHALMKAGLFVCLGCIAYRVGSARIADLAGIGRLMPWTASALVVGGLSLIGVPLTAGFVGKWYLVSAALEAGWWPAAAVMLAASLLAVAYVWKMVEAAYFRAPSPAAAPVREAPASMVAAAWGLAGANVWFGIDPSLPIDVAHRAAAALLGG